MPAIRPNRSSRIGNFLLLTAAAAGITTCNLYAGPYEGYGAAAVGGAGGPVYRVTSLADSGPGTLRDAVLNRSGPRTVVFDVGGTIKLQTNIAIRIPYLTVDGSTAPSPGITIQQASMNGGSFYVSGTHDIILTHLRLRGVYQKGGAMANNTGITGVEGSTNRPSYNLVFDHLTIRNSSDAGPDFWGKISDVTLSYCLVMYSWHPTTVSHYPSPYEVRQRISMHHNVYAKNNDRNPQVRADVRDFNMVNNVIYHWGWVDSWGQGTRIRNDTGEPKVNANIINNYWVPVTNPEWALVYGLNPGPDSTEGRSSGTTPAQGTTLTNTAMGKLYVRGNILPKENLDHYSTISSPLPVSTAAQVTTHAADQLKTVVLPSVGMKYRLADEQATLNELAAKMISGAPGCTSNAQCDDGNFCNGAETCANGTCVAGTNPCPGSQCRESDDTCVQCLANAECDDGKYCNGTETCGAAGTCQAGTNPCPEGTCDEATKACQSMGVSSVWFTFRRATMVPGVGTVEDEDIVGYDPMAKTWSMVFDGSDVGLSALATDGVARLGTGEILLSFTDPGSVPGLKSGPDGGSTFIDDSDIIAFTPTSLGGNTAGTFTFYFDGSDVGLSQDSHDVNAIAVAPDGRLLISTLGSVTVGGVAADGKDVLAFQPTSLGAYTAGTFSLYFDGSDIGLDTADEDVDALAPVPSTGGLLLSTLNSFAVPGLTGGDEDIIEFKPTALGPTTIGTSSMLLDLSEVGIPEDADVVAVELADNTSSGAPGCTSNAQCDDGNFCNGAETCANGTCVAGTNPCPGSQCRESDDTCVQCLVNAECDDGKYCNGTETCNAAGTCQTGTNPCPEGTCDEAARTCQVTAADRVWVTFRRATAVPGVGTAEDEDIVGYDPVAKTWSMVFDGSDVGLSALAIDGVARLGTGEILLSFTDPGNVPGLKGGPDGGSTYVDDSDMVAFTPTSLGGNTAGTFTFYFDGSDVGLSQNSHDINAIAVGSDGSLLLSTPGPVSAGGVTADGKDVLAFQPTSLGAYTAGSFSLYFDGSDIGLDTADEDVDALALVPATGGLLLSTLNSFAVPGLTGGDEDIIEFKPTALGPTTIGTPSMLLDLSAVGIPEDADVVAVELGD